MALRGCEIGVIGAGIGGLAAALALARRGARVRVFEQAERLGEIGAGIQLGPNAVAVLEALGLRDAVATQASAPAAIELRDHHGGRLVARVPLGQTTEARYGRPYWHLHRADLLAALTAGVVEAGVEIRLGSRVEAVETDGRGLRIAGEIVDLVVAADGLRSGQRAARFSSGAPRYTGHVAWRGTVATDRLPAGLFPDAACVTIGPGRHLVTYPLRAGRLVNFVAVERRAAWAPEDWSQSDDQAVLRRAFYGWNPAVTTLLAAVEETWLWGLFDHPPLPDWVDGRVVLLGDACHPTLPFLAQGAAMALEDAWVLAAELDAAADLDQGLRSYAARRQPRTRRVQAASARIGRLYHLGAPGVRQGVQLGLRAAGAVAPGLLLGGFDWLFGEDVTARGLSSTQTGTGSEGLSRSSN